MPVTDSDALPAVDPFLAGLPKCELHLHVEGTLEPELRLALARRNGLPLEPADADAIRATYRFDSLASFLTIYYDAMRVLLTEQDFADLVFAYLRTAAGQNVRYAEVFFDPQAHTSRGVAFGTVVRGLLAGRARAQAELGIRSGLVMCFLRDMDAESAMATLVESLPFREEIVGVGLDSDERDNPPTKFAAVFARARAEGYRLTMHCDIDQPGTLEHIRQALDVIGVDRVDHGSNAVEDPALVQALVQRGIGLTCCPVSNGFVSPGMKAAEIRRLFDAGVKVTVNSDDPAYFGAYVAENLAALQAAAGFTRPELVRLERNAFEIAWLPAAERDGYLAELDAYAAGAG